MNVLEALSLFQPGAAKMVAKISNSGFSFKSVLLGASMLTLGAVAAQAATPAAPAPTGAPVAVTAPAPTATQAPLKADASKGDTVKTDKTAKVGDQHRLSSAAEAAFEKIKAATVAAKDGLAKDGKALLSAVDEDIAAAKKKIEAAGGDAKEQWAKQGAALKTSRDKLAAQIEALGAAKAEGWEAARKGVEGAYNELSAGIAAASGKPKV
jgi:hypothetical protein